MNMKTTILALALIILPSLAVSSDWRVHLGVCNQDVACAKEQAKSRDLWDKQDWSVDLKESCRKQYIQTYSKDYTGALGCIAELEKERQEYRLRDSEINRNYKARRTYRTPGRIIVR